MYECIFNDRDNKYFDYPKCKSWQVEERENIKKRIDKYEKLVEANEGNFLEKLSAKIGLKKARKAKEALDKIYFFGGLCGM
jgi:hypothetical protein